MAHAGYDLHSTLDRALERVLKNDVAWDPGQPEPAHLEAMMFRDFQRSAHLVVEDPPRAEGDVLEWLSLMRHYGAPTRLLDWSYSFWIALFFAAVGAKRAHPCVWVLNVGKSDEAARGVLGAIGVRAHDEDLHCRSRDTFRKVYCHHLTKPQPKRFVLKQNAWRTNPRIVSQQGVFLCPSDVSVCFQSNLAAMPLEEGTVRKLTFSRDLAVPVVRRLHRFGLSRASLYPDLRGLAESLNDLPLVPGRQGRDLEFRLLGQGPRRLAPDEGRD